jgi:transcription-repair coupling factor (superfamily II helicase)
MDRLYAAMRATAKPKCAPGCIKAAVNHKQVAVIVPTTVLAQQHYGTFSSRLAPFTLRVEMLSRFKTPQEQKTIVQDLKTGVVDIVVGTHRLLQKDIRFQRPRTGNPGRRATFRSDAQGAA